MKRGLFTTVFAVLLMATGCSSFNALKGMEPIFIPEDEQMQNYRWSQYDVQKGEQYCFWKDQEGIYAENLETGESIKVTGRRAMFSNRIHNMIVYDTSLYWTEKGSYETDCKGIYVKDLSSGANAHICKEYAIENILIADGALYFSENNGVDSTFYTYSFEEKVTREICTVEYGATGFYGWSICNGEMYYAYMDEDDVYIDAFSITTGERLLHLASKSIFGERDALDCFKVADGYLLCRGVSPEGNKGVVYDLKEKEVLFSVNGNMINDCFWIDGKAYFLIQQEDETEYVIQAEMDGSVSKQAAVPKGLWIDRLYYIDGNLYVLPKELDDASKARFASYFLKIDI